MSRTVYGLKRVSLYFCIESFFIITFNTFSMSFFHSFLLSFSLSGSLDLFVQMRKQKQTNESIIKGKILLSKSRLGSSYRNRFPLKPLLFNWNKLVRCFDVLHCMYIWCLFYSAIMLSKADCTLMPCTLNNVYKIVAQCQNSCLETRLMMKSYILKTDVAQIVN